MLTALYSIFLFLLAIILDYIFNRLLFVVEPLNFFVIIPTAVLFLRKDKYGCVFFTILGIVQDSMSSAFFGIHGLASFLTAINVYWLSNKNPGESPILILLYSIAAQVVFNAYMITFLYMAERLDFFTVHLYSMFLFSIFPSAILTVIIYYGLKYLPYFSDHKKYAPN